MADAVLPHVVSRFAPGVDVLFLETGYHFSDTIVTRDIVAEDLPITLVNVMPELTVAEQDEKYGARLYERDPALLLPDAQGRAARADPRRSTRRG